MQIDFPHLCKTLKKRRLWIIAPTVAFTLLAIGYALFKQDYWMAQQALMVRDESVGQLTPLGRFESVDSMQTAQETIYEVARNGNVLRSALLDVGPGKRIRSKKKRAAWPSPKIVEAFRKQVSVVAPNGAQFGRTELIYVSVKAENPERGKALSAAVADRLIERMQQIREQRYAGIVTELTRSSAIVRKELDKTTAELRALDRRLGSDIVDLRVMNNDSMGQGTLGRTLSEIRSELRKAQQEFARNKMERIQLHALRNDPTKLLSVPSQMLDTQPTLQRLKIGLVDAQVSSARLAGEMSADHPRVRAAVLAEKNVRARLFQELRNSIDNVDGQIAMSQSKVTALTKLLQSYEGKFTNLSDVRSTYNRLTNEVEQQQKFIENIESDLAVARSNMAAASAASTIQLMDQPTCGIDPIGPGTKAICTAGIFGGLFVGFGLVWLLEPIKFNTQRRWSDRATPSDRQQVATPAKQAPVGDRRENKGVGRRASDWIRSVWPEGRPKGDGAQTVARNPARRSPNQIPPNALNSKRTGKPATGNPQKSPNQLSSDRGGPPVRATRPDSSGSHPTQL